MPDRGRPRSGSKLSKLLTVLNPADGHLRNEKGWRRRTSELEGQIVADHRDVPERLHHVPCDGDLLYRICQLAVLDPEPGRSLGKISGHAVHTRSEHVGKIQTVFDRLDHVLRAGVAVLEIQVRASDAGRRLV